MLTFPDPNVETEYTDPNGSVWEFNGTGWVRQCDCSGDGGGGDGGNGTNPDPIEPDDRYSNTECVINGEVGNSGETPVDATGKSVIVPYGSPLNISDGKYGNGGISVLKATNSYIQVPVKGDFWSRPWTLEGWFQFISPSTNTGSTMHALMASFDTSGNNRSMMLRVDANKRFNLQLSYDGSSSNVNQNTPATGEPLWDDPDRWHHVAVSHQMNDKKVNVFLNGDVLLSQPITGSIKNTPVMFISSRDPSGTNQGDFHVDDFRLTYNLCRYTNAFTPPGQVQYQQTYFSGISAIQRYFDAKKYDNDADLHNDVTTEE
jgi:hypothetical protein